MFKSNVLRSVAVFLVGVECLGQSRNRTRTQFHDVCFACRTATGASGIPFSETDLTSPLEEFCNSLTERKKAGRRYGSAWHTARDRRRNGIDLRRAYSPYLATPVISDHQSRQILRVAVRSIRIADSKDRPEVPSPGRIAPLRWFISRIWHTVRPSRGQQQHSNHSIRHEP